MHIRVISLLSFVLVVGPVYAQDLLVKPDEQTAHNLLTSDAVIFHAQQQFAHGEPISGDMPSVINRDILPDKPQPVAQLGQWISERDAMPQFPDNLVMTEKKNDGRLMWHVEALNSCAWCGTPMTWKQSMFDRKSSSMWVLRSALAVADIEITHHSPCFKAGTCTEANPLIGRTRLQGYSVAAGLTAFGWVGGGWLRKGSREYHIGGYRHWWIIPMLGDAASAVGIIANLARWHVR
jgi:hypothetical protein